MCARKRAKTKRAGSHRTKRTRSAPSRASNAQQFKGLLEWLLPRKRIFAGLGLHGNTKWAPTALIGLALCWGWAESINVTDAFVTALDQCRQLGLMPLTTYQGFMNALVRWTDPLLALLWPVLHEHMHQIGGKFWQVGEWVPIAFDGSRGSAHGAKPTKGAVCSELWKRNNGQVPQEKEQGHEAPQEREEQAPASGTAGVDHPAVAHGASPSLDVAAGSIEFQRTKARVRNARRGRPPKKHVVLRRCRLYRLPPWAQILSHGYHFLVRVGANVSLLAETTEWAHGKDGLVLCWPKTALQAGQPPLRLRLLKVKVGKTRMWMLTSVLDRSKLGRAQIIHLYQLRRASNWNSEASSRP